MRERRELAAEQATSRDVTVQPSGVVLIGPHGCLFPQRPEDGRICSHEINVDSCVQLSICQSRSKEGTCYRGEVVGESKRDVSD